MDIKKYWLRFNTVDELKDLKFHNNLKINFDQLTYVREEEGLVIIPLNVMLRSQEGTEIRQSVIFILEPSRLISIVNIPLFLLFEKAAARIARAARYLDEEILDSEVDLQSLVRGLREDINGVKEHALFEHEKIEYLQNAILAALNINQNQIVKVFTVITAVFLPPTLVATLYGMNFQKMPEYALEHGFLIAIMLTLVSAVVPLLYIKRKRWLR